jgi:hypothetical protein
MDTKAKLKSWARRKLYCKNKKKNRHGNKQIASTLDDMQSVPQGFDFIQMVQKRAHRRHN